MIFGGFVNQESYVKKQLSVHFTKKEAYTLLKVRRIGKSVFESGNNRCKLGIILKFKKNVRRQVNLRNYMSKIKKYVEKYSVNNENTNINARLHDGPVFKVTHANSEPIKRSDSHVCRGYRME